MLSRVRTDGILDRRKAAWQSHMLPACCLSWQAMASCTPSWCTLGLLLPLLTEERNWCVMCLLCMQYAVFLMKHSAILIN